MSLAVPVEIAPIKPNGQLRVSDGGADYTIIPAGHVQVMGFPQLPGTRVPSPFTAVSSVYMPLTSRFSHQVDEAAFSKNVVCPNIRLQHPSPCSVSTPRYVGLPYQDHNYVQLPPSTPPLSPTLPLPVAPMPKTSLCIIDDVSCNTTVITTDDSITRCICEFQHDDGYMIQCDRCGVWQHVDCMEVDRDNIPDSYMCEICEPRRVDKHRAIQIQTRKRDALSLQHLDSSATETEDETTDGRRRSFDKSPLKKEMKDNGGGGSSSISTVALTKKRKTKAKRDERLKRKLQLKRPPNGQKLSVTSPKKSHFEPMVFDSLGETVRQEAALPQNGALVMPLSSLNTNPPAIEIYQEAVSNCYTTELQNLLASIKFNGQQVAACSPSVYEKLQFGPSCVVAAVSSTRMGLEAREDILTNQPLIEYVGRVMLQNQYDKDNLFYHRPEPNVLFYSKLGCLDLCIDASLYGNMARFVRRSCTPNAEVRHLLEGSTVRFFLCATKSIVRGAEITIPFDFNYHKCGYLVDCACTRVSCPVAKFQRREASHSSGPAARRQRTTRSLEVMPHQEHAVLSPKKLTSSSSLSSSSSSLLTLVKHNKQPLLTSLKNETVTEFEIKKESEIKAEPSSAEETVPPSPVWHQAAPAAPTITASDNESHHPAPVCSSSATGADPEENNKSKKKTREEKKLEMVMKMFERMAKQEERKKEAQSRLEHTKTREPSTKTKEHSRKSRDSRDSRSTSESTTTDLKQPTTDAPSLMVKDEVETAVAEVPIKAEAKTKLRRSRHSTSSRRASMVSSAAATPSTSLPSLVMPVSDFSSSSSYHPVCSSTITSPVDVSLDAVPFSAALISASAAEVPTTALMLDRWTVHPKKLLMRGQELGKQLSIKTDGLDLGNSESEYGMEFVQCVPSPHSCSLSALRRNSMPAAIGCSNGSASIGSRTASLSTPAPPGSAQPDSKGCSAKKRWLQQAMCDKTELQPIDEDSVPGRQPAFASISPTDFVTPLKKRRLARESLSTDSPPPFLIPATSAPANVTFPQYESISDDEHTDVELMQGTELVHDAKSNDSSFTENEANRNLVTDDAFKSHHSMHFDVGSQTLLTPSTAGSIMLMQAVGSYHCHRDDGRLLRDETANTVDATPTPNGSGMDRNDKLMNDSLNKYNNDDKTGNKDNQTTVNEPVQLVGLYNPLATSKRLGAMVQEMQAWQNSGFSTSVSGVDSSLSAANLYSRSGLVSSPCPSGQKDNSTNVHRFFNYGPLRLSVDSALPEYAVSGLKTTPLTVGINSIAGLSNAVYLSKQMLGQTLDGGVSSASGSLPTSMYQPVSTPRQGLLSLVEAARQSDEKSKESENQNAPVQNWLHHAKSEDYRQNGEAPSNNLSYASLSWTSSDQSPKIRSYFHSSLQPTFMSVASNCDSDLMPLSSGNPAMSYSLGNGAPSVHANLEASTTAVWTEPRTSNGSMGETSAYVSTSKSDLLENSDFTAAGSLSVASSQSSVGQCHLKKKVTLDEYKMRRKSGGASASQRKLSGGSGSADSDTSLPVSSDAALSSPPLRPPSSFAVTDTNRDTMNGLNFNWSISATAAEKTLEKLQTSEKHFKPEKGEVASTEPYLLVTTRDSQHPGSVISSVQLLTTAPRNCIASTECQTTDCFTSSGALTAGDGMRSGNVYISMGPGSSFARQPVNICDAVPMSLLGKGLGPQLPPVSLLGKGLGPQLPLYLLTTTRSDVGHANSNAQDVQTSSNITGKPNFPSLVQR